MSTHSSRVFLNSCLKVPIDPCNNCPAPKYNQPKLYMNGERLNSGRKLKSERAKMRIAKCLETKNDTISTADIRTLAKFYDSIPDYCEVNHLPEAEFYSTLENLRTTSRGLRTEAVTLPTRCTSDSTSISTNSLESYLDIDKVKSKKKRQTNAKKSSKKKTSKNTPPECYSTYTSKTLEEDYAKCLRNLNRLSSLKQECTAEVADFKRTLKDYKQEFKRSTSNAAFVTPTKKDKPATKTHTSSKLINVQKPSPISTKVSPNLGKSLRKCRSTNDVTALCSEPHTTPLPQPKPLTDYGIKFNKYFPYESSSRPATATPKNAVNLTMTSIESKRSNSASCRLQRKKGISKQMEPLSKPAFTLFPATRLKRSPTGSTFGASPAHPVSRPNLAATLRAEVARRKLRELQDNCTHHDTIPQFDWEVRKTPAWKSLGLNEPHKTILAIRLATRKAEQALEQRQYELHMELMRQRVKSTPLLLEGNTYWGPHVGKLTYTSQRETNRHSCDIKQRKQRRKSASCSSRQSQVCAGRPYAQNVAPTVSAAKIQQLSKVYGSGSHSSVKSASRNSQRSSHLAEPQDSGDDLCSMDRAFL